MVLLIGALRGNTALEPLLGVSSMVMGASVILFAINVFQNVKA